MPNDAYTSCHVHGPNDEVARFERLMVVPLAQTVVPFDRFAFDFERAIPAPEGALTQAWCEERWGTRCNAYGYQRWGGPGTPLAFHFYTAWTFPWPVFERLVELFPALSFECFFAEEGIGLKGEGWFNPPPGARSFEIRDHDFCEDEDEVADDQGEQLWGAQPPH